MNHFCHEKDRKLVENIPLAFDPSWLSRNQRCRLRGYIDAGVFSRHSGKKGQFS